MRVSTLRDELLAVRRSLEEGKTERARQELDSALACLDDRLLTTTEAKEWLGIGSVNTLKLLVRKAGLQTERHGNRMMIPLSELERLQGSELLAGLRAADHLHDASVDLGDPNGLADEELELLEASRPGSLPWSTSRSL